MFAVFMMFVNGCYLRVWKKALRVEKLQVKDAFLISDVPAG